MREFDFYVVPTPIGNIEDITFRAIDILKNVDIIAAEDTRVTQKLLNHYDITTKCISYHKYNEKEKVDFFLNLLREGKKVALVSDAGTPLICDPGCVILQELRKENFKITALPGACAITTFLSSISRSSEEFTFVGFLPKSQEKLEKILNKFSHVNTVFYESPNRIKKTLDLIKTLRPKSKIVVGRELTKLYEEIVENDYENIVEKGEFVCMVLKEENQEIFDIENKIKKLKNKGFRAKEISIILSELYNLNKNDIYKLC